MSNEFVTNAIIPTKPINAAISFIKPDLLYILAELDFIEAFYLFPVPWFRALNIDYLQESHN